MSNEKITWDNRRSATNIQQAMEALADVVVSEAEGIVEAGPEYSFFLQGQIQEFADRWAIPIDLNALYKQAMAAFVEANDYEPEYSGWMASFC